jgi:hypothetical protein
MHSTYGALGLTVWRLTAAAAVAVVTWCRCLGIRDSCDANGCDGWRTGMRLGCISGGIQVGW